MHNDERFYVYFICDPTQNYNSQSAFTLTHKPFYCGKGTFSRIKSKKNKAVNDKISSLKSRGVDPEYVWLGPFEESVAFDLEHFFVNEFKRRDLYEDGVLLNLQDGGIGGSTPSKETRKKMSESHKGQIPWNKGLKGAQVAWNKGMPMSEERKQLLLSSRKEKYIKGDYVVWNKGKTYSLGDKTKNSKKIIIDGVEYCSLREASNSTGMSLYIIKRHYLKEQI